MKILMVGTDTASMANFRAPLLRDLAAKGHELILTAPVPEPHALETLAALGVRYIESPMNRAGLSPLADLKLLLWLFRLFVREKPDVLFCFQAKAIIYGGFAGWLARIKKRAVMVEGLGIGFMKSGGNAKQRVVQIVMPLLFRLGVWPSHLVFFLNPDDLAYFRQRHFVHAHQTCVQIDGIGVDLAHFAQKPLPEGPVHCLMIARLIAEKGVRIFADAARLVRQQRPDIQFVLLGPEDPSPAGVPLSEVLGWQAAGDLVYAGKTTDVRSFLAACHLFVLPTWYREGLPRSTMEAMATGRAIVTTNTAGARETVLDQVNGYLVEPKDAAGLAAAILKIVNDPAALERMGAASRHIAETRFEVGHINHLIMNALLDTQDRDTAAS